MELSTALHPLPEHVLPFFLEAFLDVHPALAAPLLKASLQLSIGDPCEFFCQTANTWCPGKIEMAGEDFLKILVKVNDRARFFVTVHFLATDVARSTGCVRRVAQRDGETRLSGRGLYGRLVLRNAEYS